MSPKTMQIRRISGTQCQKAVGIATKQARWKVEALVTENTGTAQLYRRRFWTPESFLSSLASLLILDMPSRFIRSSR